MTMIYLIGGAPRAGKSILGQKLAAQLRIGWISTDLLTEMLKAKNVPGLQHKWDATPEAVTATAEWFFPCLERFVWGVQSMADNYLIEGVSFLPAQVVQLSDQYLIRSVFLGCSQMTLERFDKFPGHSRGYATLPEEMRRQFAHDVPLWSEFIRQEAEQWGRPYVDMSEDFQSRLVEAETVLIGIYT
jgi:hypothetical protein